MARSVYIVTSPLVIVRAENGSDVYVYEGMQIPPGTDRADVRRLLADGHIRKA